MAGQHLEDAGGNAGLLGQHGQGQGREGRAFGRLDQHGAAGGQRRAGLARDHGGREIPGRDGGAHANGLAQREQLLACVGRLQQLAVHALAFLGKPFDEGGRIGDLAARLGQGLALLQRHQPRQIVLVRQHQVEPAAQDACALLARQRGPGGQGALCGGDGGFGFAGLQGRHLAQALARGGVEDVDGGAGAHGSPALGEQAGLAEQIGALQ